MFVNLTTATGAMRGKKCTLSETFRSSGQSPDTCPSEHPWDEVEHSRAKSTHPSDLSQLQEVIISTSSAGCYMFPAESRSQHVAAAIRAKGAQC